MYLPMETPDGLGLACGKQAREDQFFYPPPSGGDIGIGSGASLVAHDPLAGGYFRRVNLGVVFEQQPPAIDFVLPGLVAGTVGAIVSAGGSGKSFFALQMCAALSGAYDFSGIGWLRNEGIGSPSNLSPQKCVYLPAEDAHGPLLERIHRLGRYVSESVRRRISENLEVYSVLGSPDVLSPRWMNALCRLCQGSRLVVIDTLRRFHLADENSGSEMVRVVAALEHLAEVTGAAVVYLHHTTKLSAFHGLGYEQQASRGSSVLVDNIRWQAYLMGMTQGEAARLGVSPLEKRKQFVRLGLSKCNYCAPPDEIWLARSESGFLFKINPAEFPASSQQEEQTPPNQQKTKKRHQPTGIF